MTAIELALAPDHAGRLFRHKAISAGRSGRTRTEPAGVTWHDVSDPDLAAAGVMLTEHRGAWRLVRPLRRHGFPAGTETIAEAASPEALGGRSLSSRPVARAALLGHTRRVELAPATEGGDKLAVTLLAGRLRNVTEERACCRVLLEGEPASAARLAMALGETLPITAARCSIGEAALALGNGAPEPEPPEPAVPVDADVDEAMAHVLGALASALLRWIPEIAASGEGGSAPHAVHQARVAIRRFRSALLIFRPALAGSLDPLVPKLVALGRILGAARDWDVFLGETASEIADALDGDRRILALLADAETRRAASYAKLRTELATPSVRRLLLHLALLPSLRPWRDVAEAGATEDALRAQLRLPVGTYAGAVLDKRYKRLVSAGKRLDALPIETLHEVRKSAKKLRYALEFFQPVLPRGETKRLIKLVARAQGQLGALNDTATGATLVGMITQAGGRHDYAAGAVAGWLAARAREAASPLGETWSALRHQGRFWRAD